MLGDTAVRYSQIAPISDTTPAANYTINATSESETINVVNGPILSGVQTTEVNSAGSTFELIRFGNKANVKINGNGGNDTFDLDSTTAATGLASMTLESGERESSTFNVVATPVAVSLVGGGTDTANVGSTGTAESITAPISISDPKEFIAVNVSDSAGVSSRFVTLNSSAGADTISGLTQSTVSAQVTDLTSITLSGSSVGNTFIVNGPGGPFGRATPIALNTGLGIDSTFVQNVAAGTSVAVHGQDGSDGVSVSNAGTLHGLLGPVSIDNTFAFTNVVLDDSNDSTAQAVTLTETTNTDTISGVAPSNITATAGDVNNFTLDGGSGGNAITLSGLGAAGTITLNTGTGADTTDVQPASNIGLLDINGQSGADKVDLGSTGSVQKLTGAVAVTNGAATKLTIDDTTDTTARAVSVGATSVTGLAPVPINYSNVPALTIEGGGPNDTFAVTPSPTSAYDIVGGGPTSSTPPGNALNMELTGTTSPALSGTPSALGAQGEWTFANRSPITFSHMQSLNPTALSVGDTTTTVGGSGDAPLSFPVSLLAPSAQPVSATYASADGTATAASGAYQPASGTVLFPPGATSETVLVNALGTPTVRPPQTVLLGLLAPTNALLARSMATGTILDSFTPAVIPPAPIALPPTLTNLTQKRPNWREGTALATISRHRAPLGTSFSFSLDEAATVTLAFSQSAHGRKVHGRCIAQTKKNGRSRACSRSITRGTLPMSAHPGTDRISFQGRLSPTVKLKPGRYTVALTAKNTAGQSSHTSTLTFTIVK